jgi:hypothetical protein
VTQSPSGDELASAFTRTLIIPEVLPDETIGCLTLLIDLISICLLAEDET